ncbi:uncharacterized protein LOC113852521 [Abrus precatorius]|uniref:Uncharacterized protein LOC113852521 n=1 Tax=Abrus precatorius TaxID=3816 RepID=A0A8B8K4E4_ABRPR|nr:uncharacterized protein LOC113852521 [Abrus precatorius]
MDTNKHTLSLSPTTTTHCNSPEFEFWMLRNPSFPQPNLLSADELFVDGVLLPLHLLPTTNRPDPPTQTPNTEPPPRDPDPEPGPPPEPSPAITESPSSSTSKRWKDIFRKKNTEEKEKEKEKGKKKERKTGAGASSAELNINIWPFSRSRSAGNAGTRPKLFPGAPATRKVNSAPCSRSNSAGESKSRKWPSSPGRVGLHVGRSSPVWQVRRGSGTAKTAEPAQAQKTDKGSKKETVKTRRSKAPAGGGSGAAKARVLNLNVPMCIGYRQHLSCRSDENGAVVGSGAATNGGADPRGNDSGGNDGGSGGGGNLFNLRNLFTKKSIVTSH